MCNRCRGVVCQLHQLAQRQGAHLLKAGTVAAVYDLQAEHLILAAVWAQVRAGVGMRLPVLVEACWVVPGAANAAVCTDR